MNHSIRCRLQQLAGTGLVAFSAIVAIAAADTPPAAAPTNPPAVNVTAAPATTADTAVDLSAMKQLRANAQTAIAAALKNGGSHSIDLVIANAAQTVDLIGVDDRHNLLYKQFGKKSTLAFTDLSAGQLAAILLTLTGEADDAAAAQNCLTAGLLYALDADAMASARAMDRALALNPDLADSAQTQIKALAPIIAHLHPTPAAVILPAAAGAGMNSVTAGAAPGNPGLPPPTLAKTGYESMGISGGGSFFCPAISPADPKAIMVNSDMSCAFVSYDGGVSWRMLHHQKFRGYTRCKPGFHPTDPNTIYAANGYGGKLNVTHDRGETWAELGAIQNLQGEICIDPQNPNRMLTGSNNAVYLTQDGGQKWVACAGPTGTPKSFHFGLVGSNSAKPALYAATDQGIWRSDDGGTTWTDKAATLPGRPIQAFAAGSNAKTKIGVLYATVPSKIEGGKFAGGVYRSTDGGDTWQWAMGAGINLDTQSTGDYGAGPLPRYYAVMTTDVDPQKVWTLNTSTGFFPPHHEACFRSDDMGKTWRATYFADPRFPEYNGLPNWLTAATGQSWQGGAAFGWAIDPQNPDHILKCDAMFLFLTDDGGKTWKNGHTQAPPGVTPGKDTGFIDNGLTDTSTWNYYVDPHRPTNHYICYTDIGFARSLDSGKTWIWCPRPELPGPWHNTTYELAVDPTTPGKIWAACAQVHDIPNGNIINGGHSAVGIGGIAISTDFCATWKPLTQNGLPATPALSVVIDPQSPPGNRTLYAALWEQGVYKSDDDGKTWVKKSNGLGAAANMRVIRVQIAADGDLYALITAKKNGDKFLTDGVGLYRSKNGGDTWTPVPGSNQYLWPKDFTLDPANPGTIYLGCANATERQSGLYRTTDGGATWTLLASKGSQHFGAFLHPKNKGWIYMTLCEGPPEAGLYLSRDNGASWTPYNEIPFSNAQRVAFDPTNDSILYVCTFGGSIFKVAATPRASNGTPEPGR